MPAKRKLHLAPDFKLEPEKMLQRFAILAMSGAGKSNTAVVMAEEAYDCGIPWVAIDPKGDWWGVRASADGKKEGGLSVPVLGGLHGDIPLEETAGKLVAELVASERLTCVLDVSEFESKAAQLRFLTDFALTLLRANRDPLLLFCEEAEDYLPQKVMKSEARCAGAWHRLVKRGRFRGVFPVIISQRTQEISKAAISQVDTLLPMRTTWEPDRKKIVEWVAEQGIAKDAVEELPNLEDGEAMVWSPQKLKVNTRVRFRRRRTYDSGDTPTLRGRPVAAKVADVDLGAVQKAMAETVERVKADDPEALRKLLKERDRRINELEREVVRLEKALGVASEPIYKEEIVEVEVPVVPEGLRERLRDAVTAAESASGSAESAQRDLDAAIKLTAGVSSASDLKQPAPKRKERHAPTQVAQPGGRASGAAERPPAAAPEADGDVKLQPSAEKMLQTVVEYWPRELTRNEMAALSGSSPRSSTVRAAWTALRRGGFMVEQGGKVAPTEAGFDYCGGRPAEPVSLADAIEMWRSKLQPSAVAMFDVLLDEGASPISREELAERSGVSATSSTFRAGLTALNRAGMMEKPDSETVVLGPAFREGS